jgi:hypothetical protein
MYFYVYLEVQSRGCYHNWCVSLIEFSNLALMSVTDILENFESL